MARKKLTTASTLHLDQNKTAPESKGTELKDIVNSYIVNKTEADKYSKLAKSENEEIKKIMGELKITNCESDLGTVKISISTSETFREEELIEYMKAEGCAKNIVKKKEYIDFDALESAIYHEKISKKVLKNMDKYKDKKETVKLLMYKKKGD